MNSSTASVECNKQFQFFIDSFQVLWLREQQYVKRILLWLSFKYADLLWMKNRSDPPCERVLSINMLDFLKEWNEIHLWHETFFSDWLGVVKGSSKLRKELLFVYTFTIDDGRLSLSLEEFWCVLKQPSAIGGIKEFYLVCNFQVIRLY